MGSAGDWCLIESDPGVFTQLIKTFGVQGVQVEELWSMDERYFKNLKPIHGLIFLFKWMQNDDPAGPVVTDDRLSQIYFAKQVINNACATQAVISILMNTDHPDVELGHELSLMREFSMSFDPSLRGLALSNSENIRAAHNSMARQTLFEFDPKSGGQEEDVYHYIGYMPINGRLYELDGLRDGPIDLGPAPIEYDWLDLIRPVIMKRINKYTEGEIHFNLMALVSDRRRFYERQLEGLLSEHRLGLSAPDFDSEARRLRKLIEFEDHKQERYEKEMVRRRHNYLPFIVELLKILAEEKKLMPLYERAKEKAGEKTAKQGAFSSF